MSADACEHGTPPTVICGRCWSDQAPTRCAHGNIHDGPIACIICLKKATPEPPDSCQHGEDTHE